MLPCAIENSPYITKTKATQIVKALQDAGHVAYFVGGCVRDALLGTTSEDYDIATSALPEDVQKLFPRSRAVGTHFGVILITESGTDFEIATFRNDGAYLDGRRPENVVFSSPEEDAQRRDFTVNGMFYDPIKEEVIDFVGGRADLDKKIIRAIGESAERFREDHLRLMRAVRFATTLNFEIEATTWEALATHASDLAHISMERIRDELSRILISPRRLRGFDLLVESGIMAIIIPEILDLKGCDQPPQFHPEGDVFVHTRLMIELLTEEASLPLVLAVLLHDIGKPGTRTFDEANDRIRFNAHDTLGARMSEKILRHLKYSNEIIDATVEAVAKHMVFKDVQKMRVAKLKRFMARPHFSDELELHRVDCTSSHGMLDNYEFLQAKTEEFANEPLIPARLLGGNDLIELGWSPGTEIGRILDEIQTLQLEGTLTTREEALTWVIKHHKSLEPPEKQALDAPDGEN